MVLECFLSKRRRKNVATGVRPAAILQSNTGQNDLYKYANFGHSTVLLVKTSKLTNMKKQPWSTYFFKNIG